MCGGGANRPAARVGDPERVGPCRADDLTGRPATPAGDLAGRAAETPSAAALHWDGGRWTYRDLDARATTLANRYRDLGAVPGEAVTLCATPTADAVAALFGLWRTGCVVAPLHERITPSEVEAARLIVMSDLHIDNSALHRVSEFSLPSVRTGVQDGIPFGARDGVDRHGRYSGFPDVVLLILTSGSTGAPRAIGFTRHTLDASAAAVARRLRLTAGDRWGLCLSVGHIGGLSLVVRAVMTGSSVRLWPSFDAGAVARAVLAGDVSHLAVVPVMLRRILARLEGERVPSTLRCVLVGGAAASRGLLDEAWAAGVPVATTWGMTETASQVATAPPALAGRHPGTAGRALQGVQVRRDPDGVLCVRGPTLASLVVHGSGAGPEPLPTDPDGWFATRDLGCVGPDGLVWIEGRADAMIVSGGLNVSPAEVEAVIEGLPGVREAVVFGVPDEEWGEVLAAVVEGDREMVTPATVDRHCRERLVRGRCPARTVVVDRLPRTWTGKAMRWRARERYGPELR